MRSLALALVVVASSVLAAPAQAGDRENLQAAFDKGMELTRKGSYREAAQHLERALEISRRLLGEKNENTATIVNNLAGAYSGMGDYRKAEQWHAYCLQLREKLFGAEHADVAASLHNLANAHCAQSNFEAAEPLYLRSLKLREKLFGENDPKVALTALTLGLLYHEQGKYAAAEPLYRRCLRIRKDKLGEEHVDVGHVLNNLANLQFVQGKYNLAEPNYRRCLVIYEKTLGADHPDLARTQGNLASLLIAQARFDDAEPLLKKSLETNQKRLGADHPETGRSLYMLGKLLCSTTKYADAEAFFRASLEIRRKRLGEDHLDVGASYQGIGSVLVARGNLDAARPQLERALEIEEKRLGPGHPTVATTLNSLGVVYRRQGKFAEAETAFERSLKIREAHFGENHPSTARTLDNLALVAMNRQRPERAIELFHRERRALRRHVAQVLPGLSEADQLAFLATTVTNEMYRGLSFGVERRDDPTAAARSAEWLINGKAVVHDVLSQQALVERASASASPERRAQIRELNDLRAQRAALALTEPKVGRETPWRKLLDDVTAKLLEIEKQLGRLVRGSADPWIELDAVRRAIPADAVLIEIGRFDSFRFADGTYRESRYAAWIVPSSDTAKVVVVDLGPASAIEDAVLAVRKAMALEQDAKTSRVREVGEPEAERELRVPLGKLAKLVVDPLLPHLADKRRWLISPDGSLWLAPWAALPLDAKTYVVEKHAVQLLVTSRDLVAPPEKAKADRPMLFADPDFDLGLADARTAVKKLVPRPREPSTLRSLPGDPSILPAKAQRLPFTLAEATAIKPLLQKQTGVEPWLYEGGKALESVVKAMPAPRVLVVSTHGFFLEEQAVDRRDDLDDRQSGRVVDRRGKSLDNPLTRCGLLFASYNRRDAGRQPGDDDGILTGLEIVGCDLRGCELVVLSACDTGLGKVNVGEGVAGLRQAFHLAGAQAVLASLWQVDDAATARLMIAFFEQRSGKDQAVALAEAQRQAIAKRRDRGGAAHPFFWAAFTLSARGR